MKNKIYFLLLSVLSLSDLYAQQTLKIEGAAKMTMTGNVRVDVSGGLGVAAAAGALNVNSGTLTLSGSSVLANSGTITNNGAIVNTGSNTGTGTYKGTGVYSGSLFVNAAGGTVAPGASPGCLTFSNGYTNSGTLQIEVNGITTACTQFDRLNVTGTAALGGTLQTTFGYTPNCGDEVTIIDATALSGTFSSVTGLPPNWQVRYNYPSNGKVTLRSPVDNPNFAYSAASYCQVANDPMPVISGTTGGSFSAPPALSIHPSTGLIDLSASTVGGPYTVTYTTAGLCPAVGTFNLSVLDCFPSTTLTDMLVMDNPPLGVAQPGERIRLKAVISNGQSIDFQGVQLTPVSNPLVTLVDGSFKSTPVAVDDVYVTTRNTSIFGTLANSLLLNDFDDDLPGLTAITTSIGTPTASGGGIQINSNGTFTYTPPLNFTGNDSFNYTIRDSDLQTDTATVRIRVNSPF